MSNQTYTWNVTTDDRSYNIERLPHLEFLKRSSIEVQYGVLQHLPKPHAKQFLLEAVSAIPGPVHIN